MDAPAIAFAGLRKTYGSTVALDDVGFAVEAGQTFALVGLNGAGKTSLIKSLLDFCAIDGGSISIFGIEHRRTEARERLAFLPERFIPPYYLNGRDFLDYTLRLHGLPFRDEAVLSMLANLDLDTDALKRPVRSYSKGMTQKLGLAASFLSGKPLLVLDEPLSGLDPRARARVKQQLTRHRAAGHTVFFSTHMLPDVESLCDRIAILHQGRLRFAGTPSECCIAFGAPTLEEAFLNCIE